MSIIKLENVTREYRLDDDRAIVPLRRVNLEVQAGEFIMIVGRSGSGKTTLLNLCAGLIKPSEGSVYVDGRRLDRLGDNELAALRNQRIGFVFQFQSLLPNLTILENVALPASASPGSQTEPLVRAAELLEQVGLPGRNTAFPRQLSAGELRRVAIARALMNRPQILLADEPTADLDVRTEEQIISLLREINRSGVTVVMITHNLGLTQYAARAFTIENSTLLALEPGEQPTAPATAGAGLRVTEKLQPILAAAIAPVSAPQRSKGISLPTAFLAVLVVVLGIICLRLVWQPTAATSEITPSAPRTTPAASFQGLPGLAGLQKCDLMSANLTVTLNLAFDEALFAYPFDLKISLNRIIWTGPSFTGYRSDPLPAATLVEKVTGFVSDDGSTLLFLSYSREFTQGVLNRTKYLVALKNVPLAQVLAGVQSGKGELAQKGPDLERYVEKIEYNEELVQDGQWVPANVLQSIDWRPNASAPALGLTFGNSQVVKETPPLGGPGGGMGM